MKIEDLSHSQINPFYDLFLSIMENDFPEYDLATRKYFLDTMYSKNHFYSYVTSPYKKNLILTQDDDVHGFLIADQTFGGVGFVSWFGIRESHRNKGFGKMLMDQYEFFAKQKGAHLLEVYTFPKTVNFYNNIGFKEVGRREKGYFGVVNIIMDREI